MNKLFKYTSLLALTSFLIVGCGQTPTPADPPNENPVLESISLSGNYETSFFVNDTFSYDGLVVTAHYDDESSKVVTDYSVSSPEMSILGEQTIIVSYLDVTYTYQITVEEGGSEYQGYIKLAFYSIDIALNDNSAHYLNPTPVDYEPDPELVMPFSFISSDTNIVTVSNGGGIKSSKNKTGACVVTCTGDTGLTARCVVNVLASLPEKTPTWKLVEDYESLKEGDILVFAAPIYNVTASIDYTYSRLQPVESSFNSDKSELTSIGESTAEFYLGFEEKDGDQYMTLEAQTGEYLICTHQGKVKLDKSTKTNRFWDIHSNVNPYTGESDLSDGAIIENYVESLGYMMFNVVSAYFTTYVENSLRPGIMELPFIYRLEYVIKESRDL